MSAKSKIDLCFGLCNSISGKDFKSTAGGDSLGSQNSKTYPLHMDPNVSMVFHTEIQEIPTVRQLCEYN